MHTPLVNELFLWRGIGQTYIQQLVHWMLAFCCNKDLQKGEQMFWIMVNFQFYLNNFTTTCKEKIRQKKIGILWPLNLTPIVKNPQVKVVEDPNNEVWCWTIWSFMVKQLHTVAAKSTHPPWWYGKQYEEVIVTHFWQKQAGIVLKALEEKKKRQRQQYKHCIFSTQILCRAKSIYTEKKGEKNRPLGSL